MKSISKLSVSSRLILGFIAVLLVLSFIPTSKGPLIDLLIAKAGVGEVQDQASQYLREQREQALKGFLILSALKVGLAVLRSSEIGLILNVRIGDLAVAVYDYVNFGWKVLLAAVAYYYLAEFLLDLAGTLDVGFLWAALVCLGLVFTMGAIHPGNWRPSVLFARTGWAAFAFTLILYLGLPLAFVGAGWVSVHVTGDSITEANRFFEELRDDMPGFLGESGREGSLQSEIRTSSVTVPFPYDGTDPSKVVIVIPESEGGFAQLFAGAISTEKLKELRDYLEERSRSLASAVLRQTAAYLFNIVVFPLLMLLALYWCGKYIMSLSMPAQRFSPDPAFTDAVRRLTEAAERMEKAVREVKNSTNTKYQD